MEDNQMSSAEGNFKIRQEKTSRRRTFDSLDMQIIDELLSDPIVSSTAIASKYQVPLSTVQRRRTILESMSLLKHEYSLDPINFGLRPIQFWIMVEKGKSDEIGKHIFEKYENVLSVTIQVNAISNVGVLAYFDSSEKLFSMLEELKAIKFVNRVEFAEIVKLVGKRQANFFKRARGREIPLLR